MSKGTAIVTGAGSGVGRATAQALQAANWNVVCCGRRPDPLEETIATGPGGPGQAIAVVCDVVLEEDVSRLFSEAARAFGTIDLLFNNAGTSHPFAMIDEVSLEAWNKVLSTNLTGSFLCAREAFRAMRNQVPQGGRIINNGSISAHAPRPGSVPYTTTKHAITGLTKTLALDGRQFSIACGQIDIGNAATDMTARMSAGARQANGVVQVEPVMDAKNVADAVVYMASLPLTANVLTMTVMARDMPFVGRG